MLPVPRKRLPAVRRNYPLHPGRAFLNPHRIVAQDRRRDYGEDRYRLPGTVDDRACVIVYTMRGSAVRIISALKANRKEVADHEHDARKD